MAPKIVDRPDKDEGTPRGVRPRATESGAPPPPRAPRGAAPPPPRTATSDAKVKEALTDAVGMMGMMVAGAGAGTQNPGLALAGFNMIARGEAFAESAITAGKHHPKLRRALEAFAKNGVLAAFAGEAISLAAPVVASLVPHPMAVMVANQSIAPEAHVMALEAMPHVFTQASPNGDGPIPADPDTNSTTGAA